MCARSLSGALRTGSMHARMGSILHSRIPVVPRSVWLAFLALSFGAGCRFVSTPIARLNAHPERFHGQEIAVEGRVEAVRWLPEIGVYGFRLSSGSDSILVLAPLGAPPEGKRERIRGDFRRRFPIDGGHRPVLYLKTATNGHAAPQVDPR